MGCTLSLGGILLQGVAEDRGKLDQDMLLQAGGRGRAGLEHRVDPVLAEEVEVVGTDFLQDQMEEVVEDMP